MRYITITIVIIIYFFLISLGLNLLLQDDFILAEGMEGNTSFNIPDTSDINMTTDELSEQTTLRTFPSILSIMFGFRTPIPNGLPQTLVVIISFMNWFLIILLGISAYKIINLFTG